jgi:hypothetical protein
MINVTLEPQEHKYTLDDGTVLPATSDILKACGISQYYGNSQNALNKGTIIHKMTELYDLDDLGEYDKEYEPYLNSWIKFRKDAKIASFEVIEQPMASSLGFATTPDRFVDGCVIDIKTGGLYPSYAIQTAAHEIVIEENLLVKVKKRMVVQLKENGYKAVEYDNPKDKEVFVSAINVYKWIRNANKKI